MVETFLAQSSLRGKNWTNISTWSGDTSGRRKYVLSLLEKHTFFEHQ